MHAAAVANVKVVELLLQGGAALDVVDHHGRTALDLATEARGRPGWQRTVDLLEQATWGRSG